MPTVEDNASFWSAYEWPEGGDEWAKSWGGARALWYGTIFPRLMYLTPTRHILEIAPGYGRCTQFLLPLCQRLTVVDVTGRCIAACKKRFGRRGHIAYHVNDGRSLAFLANESIDVAFSWDSLVHADADVLRSYLGWLSTKLVFDGYGFLHHSNFAAHPDQSQSSVSWRDRTTSAALFRTVCEETGLWIVSQEIIPWAGISNSDVISVFRRPPRSLGRPPEPRLFINESFDREVDYSRRLSEFYNPGPPSS